MALTGSRPSTPPPLEVVDGPPITPPNPSVKLTLPTPPSFSANRARARSITSPDSPAKPANDSPIPRKKGHNRSVSFNQDVEIKTISPEVNRYMIPQRKLGNPKNDENDEEMEMLTDLVSPRRGPPTHLLLGNRSAPISSLRSPFRGGPKSAPVLPLQTKPSRFSSTAAARGISIAPTLAKLKETRESTRIKHSGAATAGLPGMKSIWSAGLTASGGWITPGLGSARGAAPTSAATVARQRGLSVAVIKDGKEMLVESGPITPGLPSGRKIQEGEANSQPLSAKSPGKPKEGMLILAETRTRLTSSNPLQIPPHTRSYMYFTTMSIRPRSLNTPSLPIGRPLDTQNAIPNRRYQRYFCSSSSRNLISHSHLVCQRERKRCRSGGQRSSTWGGCRSARGRWG